MGSGRAEAIRFTGLSQINKQGGEIMRSILVSVMMLIVVALLFSSIIADDTNGLKKRIEEQGATANSRITGLDTN
jgi:putative exporter of polyketide antibiotics